MVWKSQDENSNYLPSRCFSLFSETKTFYLDSSASYLFISGSCVHIDVFDLWTIDIVYWLYDRREFSSLKPHFPCSFLPMVISLPADAFLITAAILNNQYKLPSLDSLMIELVYSFLCTMRNLLLQLFLPLPHKMSAMHLLLYHQSW